MNTELVTDAPELITFFKNWGWSAGKQLAGEAWYADNKYELENQGKTSEEIYSATGIWYLNDDDARKSWVPAHVVDYVIVALANE